MSEAEKANGVLLGNMRTNPLKNEHTFRNGKTGEEGDRSSHLLLFFLWLLLTGLEKQSEYTNDESIFVFQQH